MFHELLSMDKWSSVSITNWANGEGFDIFYQDGAGQDWILPITWDSWKAIKKTVKHHLSDDKKKENKEF